MDVVDFYSFFPHLFSFKKAIIYDYIIFNTIGVLSSISDYQYQQLTIPYHYDHFYPLYPTPQSNLPAVPAEPEAETRRGDDGGGEERGGRRAEGGAGEECPGDAN